MANIWNVFGKRIGSITDLPDGKQKVYDSNGQPLGSVGHGGTVTAKGKIVSRTPMPGLLFKRQPKR
jgi:hypothetical protein